MSTTKSPIQLFERQTAYCGDCIAWTGATDRWGYGHFTTGKKQYRAHRWIFQYVRGVIIPGLQIDHLCRNRSCVNVNHLELVTASENVRRGLAPEKARQRKLSKTHCPSGHPYAGNNLRRLTNGGRACKTCSREHSQRRYHGQVHD